MPLTLHEALPLGMCLATQELLDVKKFLLNFCDGILLKSTDDSLKRRISQIKRDLNAFKVQDKFLDGYKAVLLNNMDRIINLTISRFSKLKPNEVEKIVKSVKEIMEKILNAQKFEDFLPLEAEFKKKVTLPLYELYIEVQKRHMG